jgi:hypothetical protein
VFPTSQNLNKKFIVTLNLLHWIIIFRYNPPPQEHTAASVPSQHNIIQILLWKKLYHSIYNHLWTASSTSFIIVETVDATVILQWPKHRRTTWGMVRTTGRVVLHSHVSLMVWATHCNRTCQVNHSGILNTIFSQMLYLSYAINIHLYQLVVNFDGVGGGGDTFYLQLQARKPYLLNIPHISVFKLKSFNPYLKLCPRGNFKNFLMTIIRNCQRCKNITDTSWQRTQCPSWSP